MLRVQIGEADSVTSGFCAGRTRRRSLQAGAEDKHLISSSSHSVLAELQLNGVISKLQSDSTQFTTDQGSCLKKCDCRFSPAQACHTFALPRLVLA